MPAPYMNFQVVGQFRGVSFIYDIVHTWASEEAREHVLNRTTSQAAQRASTDQVDLPSGSLAAHPGQPAAAAITPAATAAAVFPAARPCTAAGRAASAPHAAAPLGSSRGGIADTQGPCDLYEFPSDNEGEEQEGEEAPSAQAGGLQFLRPSSNPGQEQQRQQQHKKDVKRSPRTATATRNQGSRTKGLRYMLQKFPDVQSQNEVDVVCGCGVAIVEVSACMSEVNGCRGTWKSVGSNTQRGREEKTPPQLF
eukprot:1142626-Pelagomonas_calceolata.AAC.1